MDFSRIRPTDVQVGQSLPWDVYDERGLLLLSRGQQVMGEAQLQRLLEIGVFAETAALERTRSAPKKPDRLTIGSARPPSVLCMLDLVRRKLDQLALNLAPLVEQKALTAAVGELAAAVENGSRCDPDVSIAMVLLRQEGRYATRHMVNVAIVVRLVAISMGLPPEQVRSMVCAALTMNLTMITLQEVLQQQTDPLSPTQREALERHPADAVALLRRAGVDDPLWLDAVLHHHEHLDGSGYPAKLTGPAITSGGQLLALADLFCARVTQRAYRAAVASNVALRGILLERGKGIDPVLAGHFIKTLGVYPPGLMVRLANGEIGVVAKHGSKANCPIVASLIGPRGAPLSLVLRRDTSVDLYTIRETVDPREFSTYVRLDAVWGDTARLAEA
ncbi:HD-GYP domain-containing protein [Chitinolyticbacter meiyuanensis]|uniref:HD-GYP domain-containing protein n=1 Tax=Chitinolyticbacter meiyuanensis TaxID=682798 RepID=UPI0011E5C6F8|nr:HD domain-containing phosphohydrolase [Chitinolyticbacter meiyuanensis]